MRFKKNSQPLSHYERNWLKSWSGREDSNLRPLPPENDAPEHMDANPSFRITSSVTSYLLFLIRPGMRFKPNLGELSSAIGGAA